MKIFEDFDLENILTSNLIKCLFYNNNISNKTCCIKGSELLCIKFNEIDGFIKVYDGTRYLLLFGVEKYDFIHNRI